MIVNDTYYDKERVSELVEQALDTDDKRGGPVTVKNGGMLCRIPEIGDAILHADRSIEIGGIEIQRQSLALSGDRKTVPVLGQNEKRKRIRFLFCL